MTSDTTASLLPELDLESTMREGNGVRLHTVTGGDPDGPLVVLLHGFPDFWYGWRHQLPRLLEEGYRVLVPDQRGYNRSEKPTGLSPYRLSQLSADVVELIEGAGRDSAHVIGHDWGAAVAWDVALRFPDVVERLGIINVPHPHVFRSTVRSNPRQLLRSWYMFAFQLPRLPEWLLGRRDGEGLARALEKTAAPGTFTPGELDAYRAAWRPPGTIRAMLNWYRAVFRRTEMPPRSTVDQPTLVVWGEEDTALVPEMAADSVEYCTDGRLESYPTASHWVHMERPRAVTDDLCAHLE